MTAIQRILYAVDDNPCVIEEAQAMVQEDCDRRRGCGGDVGCGSSSFRKSPWMKSWSHTMGEEAHVVVTSYSNRHLCNMLSVDTLLS